MVVWLKHSRLEDNIRVEMREVFASNRDRILESASGENRLESGRLKLEDKFFSRHFGNPKLTFKILFHAYFRERAFEESRQALMSLPSIPS